MNFRRLFLLALTCLVASCAKGNIAQLKREKVDLVDIKIEGDLDKAMQSYRRHQDVVLKTDMTPESILNLANSKAGSEFDFSAKLSVADSEARESMLNPGDDARENGGNIDNPAERGGKSKSAAATHSKRGSALQSSAVQDAIALYTKLLNTYPDYERNDHALYQLARIYEEVGNVADSMKMLDRLAKDHPNSRYFEEAQFRRGEYYYPRKKFSDARDAYQAIVTMGTQSPYYEIALYKLGWAYYKLERYDDATHRFIKLLDYKGASDYALHHPGAQVNDKRVADTFRALSLSFSYLGGADAVADFFKKYGRRNYEASIYKDLGDYYLEKRRYGDAAATFNAFFRANPKHKLSPQFARWSIESYREGGFSKLVAESGEDFITHLGLQSDYWLCFNDAAFSDVTGYLRIALKDQANYYHAQYQDKRYADIREENFQKAAKWYREFLNAFPNDDGVPAIHYQLAELLLENRGYVQAANEFEKIAYDYPHHGKSADAGYAAIYALRKNLEVAPPVEREGLKRDLISRSLKYAEAFWGVEKAKLVMSAAVNDIYELKDYALAAVIARNFLARYAPDRDAERAAWLIYANSSFELGKFKDAEEGFLAAQKMTDVNDPSLASVTENLAATFYKEAEKLNARGEYSAAATYYLAVGEYAASAKIRPIADFDGAIALMKSKDWEAAEKVLSSFRARFPGHEFQPEVTKNLAFVYKEMGRLSLAAAEYDQIGMATNDMAVRREAWEIAIDFYAKTREMDKSDSIYQRYFENFKMPLGYVLEIRNEIALHSKSRSDMEAYYSELRKIRDADAGGGAERTDRTRYLGAMAALVLAEAKVRQFSDIRLTKPFDENLHKKKELMRELKEQLDRLFDYEVDEVTSAATYYLAEMYYDFSRALIESERPEDMDGLEKEQYDLSIEEQAYPFEEKAIQVYEKNLELMKSGIYNAWVDKSIGKLAKLVPARYAKFEESSDYIWAIDNIDYDSIINYRQQAAGSTLATTH